MKFYSFTDIAAVADCRRIASEFYGAKIVNDRCAAVWRGGDNPESVSFDGPSAWYDHVRKAGGGPIQLAAFKFGGDIQQAQAALGEMYNLTPRAQTGPAPAADGRYDELIRQGYAATARYEYQDAAGVPLHFVIRLQHPEKPGKEFVQGHYAPDGGIRWGLRGVSLVLYRLPALTVSPWAMVVEGEKSADRMAALGLPATTACMGAGKWKDEYSDALAGKDVAIFPDNDAPGIEHAQQVAASLHGRALSVRIVPPATKRPKGGIDDWMDEDPARTAADVLALIQAAPEWHPAAASLPLADSGPTNDQLAEAKRANSVPFRNFIPAERETEKRGRKVKEVTQEPRTHQSMLDDLSRRFLGFPRKVGDEGLFDHDRDSGEIIPIRGAESLLAWIGRRSKKPVAWARGDSMATPGQLFASVTATAYRYESISRIPSWPRRSDVYYAHGALPPPCPDHSRFLTLLAAFRPATEYDRNLLAAFICAPLWYVPGIPRPAWIIDSQEGQGCGKTTLVELIAHLYGHAPLCTSKQELSTNLQQIVKRCVSHSGRGARVFLVDNVTGDFHSDELAFLITSKDITGMAPYGHGEETRPNDLTYVVTCNTATVSTDLADRSMYIMVSRPEQTADRDSWKAKTQAFIDANRLAIVADIIDLLSRHRPFGMPSATRFPEFEATILQPCCGTPDALAETLEHIHAARAESNVEEDQARSIAETFHNHLAKLGLQNSPCFLRTDVVNSWGRQALNDSHSVPKHVAPVQVVRNLAKIGLLKQVDPTVKRWPLSSGKERHSGVAWNIADSTEIAFLVTRNPDGEFSHREVSA